MIATRLILVLAVTVAAACASACAEPADTSSTSCAEAPLLTRAKNASTYPSWYGEDWGPAPFVTSTAGPRQELCANDAAEARRLAEEYNAQMRQPPTTLVAERETAKYFELLRADTGRPLRVHRCSYLERSAWMEADEAGEVLGTLNVRPITFDVAREAARYLWSLEPQGAVISAPSTIEAGIYGQDFETALVVRGDGSESVTVCNVRITVNAFTGEIRRSIGPAIAQETCSKPSSFFP